MQPLDPHGRTTRTSEPSPGGLADAAATLCRSRRKVPWIKRPKDIAELRVILADATRDGQPVNAISTGRNWGYGSQLPPLDGTALIDLRAWREIGPLDRKTLSVRIQPGVTQGDLHRWLEQHAPDLAFNTTGAGTQTSILGCALERGIGYTGPMDADVFGLELMLADGSELRPDTEWFHPARDHAVGPAHERLFFQSNYGIVTAARVRLRQKQQLEQAIVITGSLPGLLTLLRECYASGVLTLPTHIGESGRTGRLATSRLAEVRGREVTESEVRAVFPESTDHVALSALHGRRRILQACWRELKSMLPAGAVARRFDVRSAARLEKFARLVGLRNQADRLASFLPLFGLTWGVPSDAGLQALALPPGEFNPDKAGEGAIYGNGVGALDPADAERMAAIIRAEWREAACTYIVVNAQCLITVFTLHIAAGQEQAAKQAEQRIAQQLRASGFPPYRLGIDLSGPQANPIHRALKDALDPRGIIAPGRYENR
jgi:4-cresol dehydrogenase (hydroxylating)